MPDYRAMGVDPRAHMANRPLGLAEHPLCGPRSPTPPPLISERAAWTEEVREALRRAMDERGLTVPQVAREVGISKMTLYNRLDGSHAPPHDELVAIVRALHRRAPVIDRWLLEHPVIRHHAWPRAPWIIHVGVDTVTVRFRAPPRWTVFWHRDDGNRATEGREAVLRRVRATVGNRPAKKVAKDRKCAQARVRNREPRPSGRGITVAWDPWSGEERSHWWLLLEGCPTDPDFSDLVNDIRYLHDDQVPNLWRWDFALEVSGAMASWVAMVPGNRLMERVGGKDPGYPRNTIAFGERGGDRYLRVYDPGFRVGEVPWRTRVELERHATRRRDPADRVLESDPLFTPAVGLVGVPTAGLTIEERGLLLLAQAEGLPPPRSADRRAYKGLLHKLRHSGRLVDADQIWADAWPWHCEHLWDLLVRPPAPPRDWT